MRGPIHCGISPAAIPQRPPRNHARATPIIANPHELVRDVRARRDRRHDFVFDFVVLDHVDAGDHGRALQHEHPHGRRGDARVGCHATQDRQDVALDIIDLGNGGAALDQLANPLRRNSSELPSKYFLSPGLESARPSRSLLSIFVAKNRAQVLSSFIRIGPVL